MVFFALGFHGRDLFQVGIAEAKTLGGPSLARIDRGTLVLGTSLCILPVFFCTDPFCVQSTEEEVRYSNLPGDAPRNKRSQSGYIPSDTTNLPPLCPTDDPLHDFLASECLDEIYGSFITGGHRDDKADHVNPRRGRRANIGERLQLLYGVS